MKVSIGPFDFMAFVAYNSAFRLCHRKRHGLLHHDNSVHRCKATPRCGLKEPTFLSEIREHLACKLNPKNLGIQEIVWKQGHLTISVTSLDDLRGVPNSAGATIDDCTYASSVIDEYLQGIEEDYTLEVTTPGTTEELTKDREFDAFKGFPVQVKTSTPVRGHSEFVGTLQGRTDSLVIVSVKGRSVKVPRESVSEVKLISTVWESEL